LVSGKYFNKGVKALDEPNLGHVVRETPDKIIVFGGKIRDMIYLFQKSNRLAPMFLLDVTCQRLKVNIE
jgi:hypothetical protein